MMKGEKVEFYIELKKKNISKRVKVSSRLHLLFL